MAATQDPNPSTRVPLPSQWGGDRGEDRAGRALWFASLALWTILSLADAVDYYAGWRFAGSPASFARALGAAFPGWMIWAALAPLIWYACHRIPLGTPVRGRAVAVHFLFSIGIGVLHTAVHTSAGWVFGVRPSALSLPDYYTASLFDWLPINILMYWAVVGAFYGLEYYRRYQQSQLESAELARRLSEARLEALQHQLHPHFLFNTLNAAVGLVRIENGPAAIQVLTRLSDILRHLLHGTIEPEIALEEEVAFLDRYLEIERVRFSHRLLVTVSVPEHLRRALVPNLVLQPLVENAIRHGLGADAQAGRVAISASSVDGRLTLSVTNDGPGLPGGWTLERSAGVGLSNTRSRLSHLYGDTATLTLSNVPRGVKAEVTIPLRFAQPTPSP
jgi:hypothetical protein